MELSMRHHSDSEPFTPLYINWSPKVASPLRQTWCSLVPSCQSPSLMTLTERNEGSVNTNTLIKIRRNPHLPTKPCKEENCLSNHPPSPHLVGLCTLVWEQGSVLLVLSSKRPSKLLPENGRGLVLVLARERKDC